MNGSVPVWIYGGPGSGAVKEKVNMDLKPSWGQFLGSEHEIVKGKVESNLEPDPYMGRVNVRV